MKKWISSALMLISFSTSSLSHAESCGMQFLRGLIDPLRVSLVSAEDRTQIAKWFADSNLTHNEASLKTLDLVLQKRIHVLPEEFAKTKNVEIADLWNRVEKNDHPYEIGGRYWLDHRKIELKIPKKYFDTWLDYRIKFHEYEHALQFGHLEGKVERAILQNSQHEIYFEFEMGAMLAEYQYLNALPREAKATMIAEIEKEYLHERGKESIIRQLKNSSELSPQDYLEQEWLHGRYHVNQFGNEGVSLTEMLGKKGTAAVTALSAVGTYAVACGLMLNRETTFYRTVCIPIFGFPTQEASRNPDKTSAH